MDLLQVLITGVLPIVGIILPVWLNRIGRRTHQEINEAAYELAYRGTLRQLAARQKWLARDKTAPKREQAAKRKALRLQEKAGKSLVMVARFQDRRSARAGVNDAIDDIKSAVSAASSIDKEFVTDHNFAKQRIGEKLQTRFGNRPALQILQTQDDAA